MLKFQPRRKKLSQALSLQSVSKGASGFMHLLEQAENLAPLNTALEESLPERFKGKFQISAQTHTSLVLCCNSASLATRFRMEQRQILKSLNQRLSTNISTIKIKIRPGSHAESVEEIFERKISAQNAELLLETAQDTQDEALKKILTRLAGRAKKDETN